MILIHLLKLGFSYDSIEAFSEQEIQIILGVEQAEVEYQNETAQTQADLQRSQMRP